MTTHQAGGRRVRAGAVSAIALRPSLWIEALRTALAMARRGWWRSAPFLPAPEASYLAWRTATAYGSASAPVDADDVVAYLRWRKRFRRAVG